ncbi:MAG: oxaloacetate-decarboxylating malate dehydrogenase, partial [Phycisphaeraceae bacterium]|nr:oxaloacetate-decarboxylating malate dehydrogenase [Phycisphaeraceae bacterium]
SMEQQVHRVYDNIARKTDPLEQYIGLIALQDRNETLFYRLMLEHLEEFMPIVYTPTVGLACQRYSHVYRRPRGLWITPDDVGRIDRILSNAPVHDVRLIVVTDNERILGLGDLGAGGIGIPIGKLVLYTVAAGIDPNRTLPISLDVGTDNKELLEDELYLGWRHPRLRGKAYDDFVEEFVKAVQRCFPRALLQWEDFKKANAFRLLDRYRERILSFNDDIQGTAAIGVAALLASARISKLPLQKQKVLMVGAGAAGVGIARQLHDLFARNGIRDRALVESILLLDSRGLIHDAANITEPTKAQFAWTADLVRQFGLPLEPCTDLPRIIAAYKPTVLIGTSGQAGIFDQAVVQAMAKVCDRPVILPLSNPTSKCEGEPAQIIPQSDGRAIVATGSPFDPVTCAGRTIRIGQGNNVYVFPAVGLAALLAKATRVTDGMFSVAAQALAAQVSDDDLAAGSLFPPLSQLRTITARITEAVLMQAQEEGVSQSPKLDRQAVSQKVKAAMWQPAYPPLTPTGS